MFQRYTDETERAVYFGAQRALYDGASAIDSSHLLLGLLMDDGSRADRIFHLRELLPGETVKQSLLKNANIDNKCKLVFQETSQRSFFGKQRAQANEIKMASEGKRILTYAAREANQLRDYWIETEHLILGILRDGENAAAVKLRSLGLNLETSRQRVIENKASRPHRSSPVLWWVRRRPIGFALGLAFILGITTALVLLGVGTVGILLTIACLALIGLSQYVRRLSSSS